VKTKINELIPRLSPASGFRLYLQSGDGVKGGVWPCPPEGHAIVVLYIAVDDMAAYVEKARQLGGSVIIPPQKLPEGDEMAVIHDLEGLAVGLFKPASA